MSLGHMTKQEQAITLGGMLVGMPIAGLIGQSVGGENGMFAAFGVMAVLIFVGKAWAWQYTSYEDGLTNPKFDRGKDDDA